MNAWRNPGVLAAIVFGDIVWPRHTQMARTGACFALAPFAGALLTVPLSGERLTPATPLSFRSAMSTCGQA